MSRALLADVLVEVHNERTVQDARWGVQDHPDGTGPNECAMVGAMFVTNEYRRELARYRCDRMSEEGRGTWEHILTEEWAEVIAEDDTEKLRSELIQLAAVAVAWVQAIDRRTT